MGLPQQLPLPTKQLPDTILAIEVAHQGAVVGLPRFASLAGQAQQTFAEMIHATPTPVELAKPQGINLARPQGRLPLELGDQTRPRLNPASRQQGLQQQRLRCSCDVEQGRPVIDAQPMILAGAPGAGPPARASPCLPKAEGSGVTQAAQLGNESAARYPGPDHGDGIRARTGHTQQLNR